MDEVENIFCLFPNTWVLRMSRMGCYAQKCEKMQNYCTLLHIHKFYTMKAVIHSHAQSRFLLKWGGGTTLTAVQL
jgi:hypothetical protein